MLSPGPRSVYRLLLRLLPADMRDRFGADMEDVLAKRLDEAEGSMLRRVGVWTSALADVGVQSVSIRFENRERGVWRMGAVLVDLRSSLRTLRKSPGFTLAAVATLALGIGASTATFSVVHSVLLEKLPVQEPDRLVFVWPEVNANKAMALRAAEEMPSLQSVSGLSVWTLTLTGAGEPLELRGLKVQPGYFDLLGVAPELGRAFQPDADLPGQAGVVILSHDLWVRAFGSDPGIIDRIVDVGGADYDRRRVVGVMPPGVNELWEEVDVWIPLEADRSLGLTGDDTWYVNQRLARLAPGATLAQANAEVRSHAQTIQQEIPDILSEEDAAAATVQPFRHYLTRDIRAAIWIALAAVGLVLLIGCFNVANLLLARGDGRARDMAVRAALGAGRTRLTRMLVAEAGVIGGLGGAVGVGMAYALVHLIARNAPPGLPGIADVSVNGYVLAFALGATALSVIAAGLVPAIRVGRVRATASLRGSSRGSSGRGTGRVTPLLVGSQIALAVVVTVGSGLMLRSLSSLLAVDTGIDGEGVLAFKPSPPPDRYPDGVAIRDFYDRVSERVSGLPEISAVGGIHLIPGRTSNWSFPTHPEGYARPAGSPTPSVNFRAVRGDYFDLTRIPVLAGRPVDARDGADDEPVVAVNESFVQRFWPGEDPLGRTVRIFSAQGVGYRIVGVVGDVRQFGPAADPSPEMYFSHHQVPWDGMPMWILARVSGDDPEALARAVQAAVWEIDPAVPVATHAPLIEILDESTGTTRFLTWLLSSFGLLALILCAVGVFGVTAYTSGRRKSEFGVRLALGSSRRKVVLSGLSRSIGPVGVGMVVGLAAAASSASLLQSALYGIEPWDAPTFVGVGVVLAAVAVLAAAVPAWRASRVDPMTVLGSD